MAIALFDDNNELERLMRRVRPVFLLGRRGSGKTAFLKTRLNGALAVDVSSPTILAAMSNTISELQRYGVTRFAEETALLWDAALTSACCARLWSGHVGIDVNTIDAWHQDALVFGYLERSPEYTNYATENAARLLRAIREAILSSPDPASLPSLIEEVSLNGVPLWRAREVLRSLVVNHRVRMVVSIDSLESYDSMLYSDGPLLTAEGAALQGLFRIAGEIGREPNPVFEVRVSFPAEVWYHYSKLSLNPLKDFDNCMLLHWNAGELYSLLATRLLKHLRLYHPTEYRRLDIRGSRWAPAVLSRYLPAYVTNAFGGKERPLTYMMRHTQLLPRHALTVFNHVFGGEEELHPQSITPKKVRDGVHSAERIIAQEIIDAYGLVYPQLDEVCQRTIPRLELSFTYSQFAEAYHERSSSRDIQYQDALEMLLEVGAIGAEATTTSMYQKADFEYLHVTRMLVGPTDTLCLHPLFAAKYRSVNYRNPDNSPHLPVLPLGSDFESQDGFARILHLTR